MAYEFPMLINGEFIKTDDILEIHSPFDGRLIGHTYRASPAEIEKTIVAAEKAFEITKRMPVYERAEKLALIAGEIRENKEEFAQLISEEAAKPIKTSRAEVERGIFTFTDAVEE